MPRIPKHNSARPAWCAAFAAALLLPGSIARATAPAPGGTLPPAVREAAARGVFDLPARSELTTSAAQTDWLVPVLLVGFSDSTLKYTAAQLQHAIFDTTHAIATGSLVDYYQWASAGRLRVRGEVVATVRLPNPNQYYSGDANGVNVLMTPNNDWGLVRDALLAANPLVDWTRYDRDGDGFVDMLWIVHAGLGGELTGSRSNFWSITSRLSNGWSRGGSIETDDFIPGSLTQKIRIDRFSMLPELSGFNPGGLSEIGVYCHEFGHALGLPDLYDTTVLGGAANVGPGDWSLMSTGAYGGDNRSPQTPVGLGAWPMLFLGWADRVRPARDTTLVMKPYSAGGSVAEVWFQGETNPEHFLLECRARDGFDANLPTPGLIVYQVDDGVMGQRLASNRVNTGPTPGLRILEGDGDFDLGSGANRGDAFDALPGASGKTLLDDDTSPPLRAISGAVTNLALRNIAYAGANVTITLQVRAPGWQPGEVTIDPAYSPLADIGRGRRAVITSAGTEYEAFSDARSGTPQILLRTRAFGGAWSAPEVVTASPMGASQPALALLPGDDLALVWTDTRAATDQVWFRARVRGTWTAERALTAAAVDCATPALAADPHGRLFATWLELATSRPALRFMPFLWSAPFGPTWTVSDTADVPTAPMVTAAPDGRAFVFWPDRSANGYVLDFARWVPDSGMRPRTRFTANVPFAQPTVDALVDTGGVLHVVYQQITSGQSEVHYQRRLTTGVVAPRDTVLESSAEGLQSPTIAMDFQGGLHVLFERSTGAGQALRYRRYRAGHGWDVRSTEVSDGTDGSVSRASLLALSNGDVSVVYSADAGTGERARSRRRRLDAVAITSTPAPLPVLRPELTLGPNPVRPGQTLMLQGAALAPGALVELLDASGRRVAQVRVAAAGSARFGAGTTTPLAPGLYFARVRGGAAARLVVLR